MTLKTTPVSKDCDQVWKIFSEYLIIDPLLEHRCKVARYKQQSSNANLQHNAHKYQTFISYHYYDYQQPGS